MNDYRLVSCTFHDELEALATRQQRCHIQYRSPTDEMVAVDSRIVDVFAEDHADYLKLEEGTRIRLDRLIEVDGKPVSFIPQDQ